MAAETEAVLIFEDFTDVIIFADFLLFQFHQKTPLVIEWVFNNLFFNEIVLLRYVVLVVKAQIVETVAQNGRIE